MLPGTFLRKLQKCNRNLRIYPSADLDRLPSGLYVVDRGELRHICGVDNRDIPERGRVDWVGHILKRGWRTTVEILIGKKLVDRRKAQKVFNTRFGPFYTIPPLVIGKKPVDLRQEIIKESQDYKSRHGGHEESITMDSGLLGDFAKEIQKLEPIKKPKFEDILNGK